MVAVVVTFNRLALLQRLIARLGEVEGLAEVLVVDNASTDGTGAWLAATPTTGEIPVLARTLDATAAVPAASTTASAGRSTATPTWSG